MTVTELIRELSLTRARLAVQGRLDQFANDILAQAVGVLVEVEEDDHALIARAEAIAAGEDEDAN